MTVGSGISHSKISPRIIFEQHEVEIFHTAVAPTRANTVQNYFFSRLAIMLREGVEQVKTAYCEDPCRVTNFVYPAPPRRTLKQTTAEQFFTYMRIASKERIGRQLTIPTRPGGPLSYPPVRPDV